MTATERYKNPSAFHAALQARLRQAAKSRDEPWLVRRRKFMIFDRLLARLLVVAPERWLLKGAVALEFRLSDKARATVDLDLYYYENEQAATTDLIKAQSLDLGDYFTFSIERTTRLDKLIDALAVRYRVEARLDGRRFEFVTLDVGFDQHRNVMPDFITGPDLFSFAGIPPIQVPAIPLETHVAEKLHAYTRVYSDGRQSTRVKDLVDLVLILENCTFESQALRSAIDATFASRAVQAVPESLPQPPPDWKPAYRVYAVETGLDPDIEAAVAQTSLFLNPLLQQRFSQSLRWDPARRIWQ